VPGFAGAQRYRRNARDYLAVYDLDAPAVLQSPDYAAVKDNPSDQTRWMLGAVDNFTRYIGRPVGTVVGAGGADFLDAPILYAVLFTVPEERLDEFDSWYEEDHVPLLLESPDWL